MDGAWKVWVGLGDGQDLARRVLMLCPPRQDLSQDEAVGEAPGGTAVEGYLYKRASNAFKTWSRYRGGPPPSPPATSLGPPLDPYSWVKPPPDRPPP